jgi:hypothetical protein
VKSKITEAIALKFLADPVNYRRWGYWPIMIDRII